MQCRIGNQSRYYYNHAADAGERKAASAAHDGPVVEIPNALLNSQLEWLYTTLLTQVSEKLVQQAVQRLVAGRTVLVIAHRLSTVQTAHQIAVLRDGALLEIGTHEQLLANDGEYANLMNSQEMILGAT